MWTVLDRVTLLLTGVALLAGGYFGAVENQALDSLLIRVPMTLSGAACLILLLLRPHVLSIAVRWISALVVATLAARTFLFFSQVGFERSLYPSLITYVAIVSLIRTFAFAVVPFGVKRGD